MVRAIRRRQAIFMAKFEVVWVGVVGGRAGRGLLMLILGGGGIVLMVEELWILLEERYDVGDFVEGHIV